jgi:hypothetical protein
LDAALPGGNRHSGIIGCMSFLWQPRGGCIRLFFCRFPAWHSDAACRLSRPSLPRSRPYDFLPIDSHSRTGL